MEKVSDSVLRRIRALLAMSRGNANEHEAAVAAQKVQELLTSFNLTLDDVDKRDSKGKVIEDGDLMTSSSNPWRRDLAFACARLYFCDYFWAHVYVPTPKRKTGYIRGDKHTFIGLPHNVVVAKEMFVYFVDTVERLAKAERKKKAQTHSYEHAFRHGCAMRLKDRIWARYFEQSQPPAGLITKSNVPALYKGMAAEVSDYMEKNHKELKVIEPKGKQHSWEGVWDGNRAGNTISLDTQIGAEQTPRMIGDS